MTIGHYGNIFYLNTADNMLRKIVKEYEKNLDKSNVSRISDTITLLKGLKRLEGYE